MDIVHFLLFLYFLGFLFTFTYYISRGDDAMKKLCICIVLLFLFYGKYENVDVNSFKSSTKMIEVKGAVKKPGVYEVGLHAKTAEVLQAAGGVLATGDEKRINKTQDLPDKSVLVVPEITEKKRISLNSGTLEELDSLPGIGPAVAKRIMDYRAHTPFVTIEDIKQVKGIGDKLFLKLKDEITL